MEAEAGARPSTVIATLSEPAKLAAVVGFCVGLPVASAIATGSIAIPHNDDWAFFRILFHLAETGDLQLVGWNEMMFFGQLVWALPLAWVVGENLAAVTGANAVVSAVGLVLTYKLARRFVSDAAALVVTLSVGIFPGYITLVATFMTEPSAYAAQVGCLLLGLTAIGSKGRRRAVYIVAALVVGLYGFSIREFALAGPVAVLVGLLIVEVRSRRFPVLSVTGALAVATIAAALYTWRQSMGAGNSHFFGLQLGELLAVQLTQNLFTVAFGLLVPLIFVAARRRWRVRPAGAAAAAVVLALGAFALTSSAGEPTCCLGGSGSVFRGNLLTQRGPLGNQVLPGDRPTMPLGIWLIMSGAALAAAAVLVGGVVERARSVAAWLRRPAPDVVVLVAFGVVTAGAIVFRALLGGPTFDRYLTPLVLVGAILLLRGVPDGPRARRSPVVVAAIAFIALLSMILVTAGHSYDAARWRAAEETVSSGIRPENVDGGFEWVGFHYDGVTGEPAAPRSIPHGPGYLYMFPAAGNCGVVMSSPSADPRFEAIGSVDYTTWLGLRTEQVWAYRFTDACDLVQMP